MGRLQNNMITIDARIESVNGEEKVIMSVDNLRALLEYNDIANLSNKPLPVNRFISDMWWLLGSARTYVKHPGYEVLVLEDATPLATTVPTTAA